MAVRNHSHRGARQPELLAAARRLFSRQHYSGTTIEEIARTAGFSKRTVYLYFKNKDELFIAVAEEGLVILRSRLEAIPLTRLEVEAAVEGIANTYLSFAREEPDYFRMIFQEATAEMIAHISDALRRRIEEHEYACLSIVAAVVDRAMATGLTPPLDRWETAVIFWGMVTGIILLSMGGSQTVFGRRTREGLVRKAVWILFEGLKKPAVTTLGMPNHQKIVASAPSSKTRRKKRV